jgi:hypothetical protein
MTLRQVFSTESNRALFATPWRGLLVCGSYVALLAAALLLQVQLPWWVFTIAGVLTYVGLLFLGHHWADRDLLAEL